MADLGGVGKQVTGELIDVAKQAVKDTAKAGADIARGTTEVVVGGGAQATPTASQLGGQGGGENVGPTDPLAALKAQNAARARQRLAEVQAELAAFRKRKVQEEEQKEQVEEEEKKMEDLQQKESDKKKREQDLIRSTQRQYGGTGEAAKKQF